MEKGEAYISAEVNSIDDIVSRYSISEYEWINSDFAEYVENSAKYIPVEESIILEISGAKFTEEEQETISRVIKDYFGLELGDKIIDLEINKRRAIALGAVALVSIIIFFLLYLYTETPIFTELFAFGFWFSCWEAAELGLLDRSELRAEKLEAGQLASLKIKFID